MTYTAICERRGGWWEITVPELPSGRVTQARRLSEVDETVKDLVSLMTGIDPAGIEVRKQVSRDKPSKPALPLAAAIAAAAAAAGLIRRVLQGR